MEGNPIEPNPVEDECTQELPPEVCPEEYNCGIDKFINECSDPGKRNPNYCTTLRDFPGLGLKLLPAKNSAGGSMPKMAKIQLGIQCRGIKPGEEHEIEHCPNPEHCPTTYSACTDPRKTKPGYCSIAIPESGDPEQFYIRDDF